MPSSIHPTSTPTSSRLALTALLAACLLAAQPAMAQQQPGQPAPAGNMAPSSANAAPAAATAAAPAPSAALPETKTQGSLRYTCGGISVDESQAMRAAMKDHPLSLLFAAQGGAYLADVQVKLVPQGWGDAGALTFTASGPVCLLDLPAGSYEVEASAGGKEKRQTVMVGKDAKTLDFRF